MFIFFNGMINFRLACHTIQIYTNIQLKRRKTKKSTHNKKERADLYIRMFKTRGKQYRGTFLYGNFNASSILSTPSESGFLFQESKKIVSQDMKRNINNKTASATSIRYTLSPYTLHITYSRLSYSPLILTSQIPLLNDANS